MALNCNIFDHRTDFASYVYSIEESTNGNISLAQQCSPQICQVLWGTGNGDISGIGMLVGYIISNALGILLAGLCVLSSSQYGNAAWVPNRDLVLNIFDSYFECALFYAFSTEMASAIMVTKVTFGLNADGMGNLTLRITWAGAALTILPLAYRMLIRNSHDELRHRARLAKNHALQMRRKLAFPLYCICWAIFFFTFLNKMADTYGPSQIGSGGSAVISYETWAEIQSLCDGNWTPLTPAENTAIDGVYAAASLIICTVTMVHLLAKCFRTWNWRIERFSEGIVRFEPALKVLRSLIMTALALLAIGLTWSVLRLASLQKELALAIGQSDDDDNWTFGQIVSVTIFAPVLVEIICEALAKWSMRGDRLRAQVAQIAHV